MSCCVIVLRQSCLRYLGTWVNHIGTSRPDSRQSSLRWALSTACSGSLYALYFLPARHHLSPPPTLLMLISLAFCSKGSWDVSVRGRTGQFIQIPSWSNCRTYSWGSLNLERRWSKGRRWAMRIVYKNQFKAQLINNWHGSFSHWLLHDNIVITVSICQIHLLCIPLLPHLFCRALDDETRV